MLGNLANEFELLLEKEATRIMGQLLIKYEQKEKVNKPLNNLVCDLAQKDYKYFSIDLFSRIKELLPQNLREDWNGVYALISKEDHTEDSLMANAKQSLKRGKNHEAASKMLAELIIDYCDSNPDCEEDLIQLIVRNIAVIMPDHNDSVDCKTIMLYLEEAIVNNGYIFKSIKPVRIKKISFYN